MKEVLAPAAIPVTPLGWVVMEAGEARVAAPFTKVQLGMTSANSSAYSQLPAVATSHAIGLEPVVLAKATNRKLNIRPLKATGVNANQAALN